MSLLFAMFIFSVVLIFAIGIYSLLVTHNLMRILISIEILTKAVTLLLIVAGYVSKNMAMAEAYVITVIIIEVVLMAVATGLVLGLFRANGTLDTRKMNR
ncbi:MAG: NADH-quinone oxidoreductase subunit K [Eubacteriales bacterium]